MGIICFRGWLPHLDKRFNICFIAKVVLYGSDRSKKVLWVGLALELESLPVRVEVR